MRTTDYTWFIYGHVPATISGQNSQTVFGDLWSAAFGDSGDPTEWAADCFSKTCSSNGENPASHIVFGTALTKRQFWYAGVRIATMFVQTFPVQDGDTPDEIMASQDVADFVTYLAGQGIYVTIQRNDLGQNKVNYAAYLSNYSLQII